MATAIKQAVYVAPVEPPFEIVLTLNKKEAHALAKLTASVAGDSGTTARKYTDAITKALYDVGIYYSNGPELTGLYRSISFAVGTA
jgi:hypothetical protein